MQKTRIKRKQKGACVWRVCNLGERRGEERRGEEGSASVLAVNAGGAVVVRGVTGLERRRRSEQLWLGQLRVQGHFRGFIRTTRYWYFV